jgi:Fe2+ transport system protein FeoA
MATNPALWMPLSMVASGRSVVFRRAWAGQGLASRLAAMGLVPGVEVHVYRNDRNGPVVLGIAGSRVMLGRGMAEKLSVEYAERLGAHAGGMEITQ